MKTTFIIFIVIAMTSNLFSQSPSWKWANQQSPGGISNSSGKCISVDANGNSYVTGGFGGSIILGGITLTSVGSYDMYIIKYNSNGIALWAKSAGGTGYDYGGIGINVDIAGDVYVTGGFSSTAITFGTTTLAHVGTGYSDIFIAKYSSAGDVLWAKSAGGIAEDYGVSLL